MGKANIKRAKGVEKQGIKVSDSRGVWRYARSVGAGPCVSPAADACIDVPVCAPTLSSMPELRPFAAIMRGAVWI